MQPQGHQPQGDSIVARRRETTRDEAVASPTVLSSPPAGSARLSTMAMSGELPYTGRVYWSLGLS